MGKVCQGHVTRIRMLTHTRVLVRKSSDRVIAGPAGHSRMMHGRCTSFAPCLHDQCTEPEGPLVLIHARKAHLATS